jgi:hypothetical protein
MSFLKFYFYRYQELNEEFINKKLEHSRELDLIKQQLEFSNNNNEELIKKNKENNIGK